MKIFDSWMKYGIKIQKTLSQSKKNPEKKKATL